MNRLNVLFLGGAKRVSFAEHLKAAGKQRGMDVSIFSYELEKTVPIGKVAEVLIGLKWSDKNIYADLENVIEKHDIHIVLPFVDKAIEITANLKSRTKAFIPISSVEICKTMFDKVQSSDWFEEKGIPQPPKYKSKDDIKYPAILKPRNGSASKGIVIAEKSEDIENVVWENYLVQEFIPNAVEYTVDCYVSQKGEPTSIVPRVRLETAGGEVTKTITRKNDQLIAIADKILRSGKFRGPITIQFITDQNEKHYYVMEINPRFGGGVIASIEAGSMSLHMLLDEYEGKEIVEQKCWKENILMTRYMQEVIYANNY
jgi:carbamoyl-phosphate synthase large subunit